MKDTQAIEAHAEAGRWLARLQQPDCTAAERAACARWRARDSSHETAYLAMEDIARRSVELADDPLLADALREADRPGRPRRRTGLRFRLPLLAALSAALTIGVVAIGLRWGEPTAPGVRYTTALGERRTVEFSDGSVVVLDTHTALVERYAKSSRVVELETGQARFEVARDPSRPFVVRVAGGTVTAVGTQFQVRTDPTGSAVTLLEGRVVVEASAAGNQPRQRATLSPGDRLRFDPDGRPWSTERVDLDVADAWTHGNLLANDWRLADLVVEMNRYSATQLRLADPTLADVRISGAFRTGDQPSLVRVLEHGWQVQASPGPDGEVLLTRRPAQRR